MQTYEKERDFYYSKLREIEELCNRLEESQGESATLSVASLKAILYRTEEVFLVSYRLCSVQRS